MIRRSFFRHLLAVPFLPAATPPSPNHTGRAAHLNEALGTVSAYLEDSDHPSWYTSAKAIEDYRTKKGFALNPYSSDHVDPDILAIRSYSPSYRARRIADAQSVSNKVMDDLWDQLTTYAKSLGRKV